MEYRFLYKVSGLESAFEKISNSTYLYLKDEQENFIDHIWLEYLKKLSLAETYAKSGVKSEGAKAFKRLYNTVDEALRAAQIADRRREALNYPLDGWCYFDCLVAAYVPFQVYGENMKDETTPPTYSGFIQNAADYRRLEKKSLGKVFLSIALFALCWFGIYKLLTAPGAAVILGKPIWDELSSGVSAVLFIVLFVMLISRKGFIVSGVLSFVITLAYMTLAVYPFAWLVNLIPPLAGALEPCSQYAHILGMTLLIVTCIPIVRAVKNNTEALGKKKKLSAIFAEMDQNYRCSFPYHEKYGLMYEVACVVDRFMKNGEYSEENMPFESHRVGIFLDTSLGRYSEAKARKEVDEILNYCKSMTEDYDWAKSVYDRIKKRYM